MMSAGLLIRGQIKVEWKSDLEEHEDTVADTTRISPPPAFEPVQLASPTTMPPSGENWLFELKFDGWRVEIAVGAGSAKIYSRNGTDLTTTLPDLVRAAARLPLADSLLDGELVAVDEAGVASFSALQRAIHAHDQRHLQIYVFDVLRLNGHDKRGLSLRDRRPFLEAVFDDQDDSWPIRLSETFPYSKHLWDTIVATKQEGLIAKCVTSRYSAGRSRAWLKLKARQAQEFVIGGYIPGVRDISALLVGYYDRGRFQYAGKVGTGFNDTSAAELRRRLDAIQQSDNSMEKTPRAAVRTARWVKPQLICQVEFAEWTASDHLRHASYQGLRTDKAPIEIGRN